MSVARSRRASHNREPTQGLPNCRDRGGKVGRATVPRGAARGGLSDGNGETVSGTHSTGGLASGCRVGLLQTGCLIRVELERERTIFGVERKEKGGRGEKCDIRRPVVPR